MVQKSNTIRLHALTDAEAEAISSLTKKKQWFKNNCAWIDK
jgi:hypothetical protein